MSELIDTRDHRTNFNHQLLATASALALIGYVASADTVKAEDSDRPTVWIELGAQLEQANGGNKSYVPPFYGQLDPAFTSPTKIQGELPWALGPEAKISFQPKNTDWTFSVGVRYGRTQNSRSTHQQGNLERFPYAGFYAVKQNYTTPGLSNYYFFTFKCCHSGYSTPDRVAFTDVQSRRQERHLILDFQAGKDVGLGMLGRQGTSVVNAGVRIAQFKSNSKISVKARGDIEHYNIVSFPQYAYFRSLFPESRYPQKYSVSSRFRDYSLLAGSSRDTLLVGPSLSWNASAAIAGNSESAELTLDWGVNVAVLFGKQKAKVYHQTTGILRYGAYDSRRPIPGYGFHTTYNHPRQDISRSRSVTVPNIGGMGGFSIKWPNAKISFGYRADIFFGAMDDGWDTAKKESRSFYGPFASISIGLGG